MLWNNRERNDMKRIKILIIFSLVVILTRAGILYFCEKRVTFLNGEKIVCEYSGNIYLFDSGSNSFKILLTKNKGDGSENSNTAIYSQPVLSPDENKIICVGTFSTGTPQSQNDQLLVLDLTDGQISTIVKVPFQEGHLGSPIWSIDGNETYFLKNNNLDSCDLKSLKVTQLASMPTEEKFYAYNRFYLRQDGEGKDIYILAPTDGYRGYEIFKYNLETSYLEKLFAKESTGEMVNPLLLKQIAGNVGQNAFGALFGSAEYPVFEPTFSKDRRFYFFVERKNGAWAKHRLAAYDTKLNNDFDLKVFYRSIYSE